MNVGELKELLKEVPDDIQVFFAASDYFDGLFKEPCLNMSGVAGMVLNNEEEQAFILVPCNYFNIEDSDNVDDDLDDEPPVFYPELN
jgi:hypothetical protein